MSRTLRTLFTALVLALALAAVVPVPSEAAGSRPSHSGPSLTDFIQQWIVSFLEKVGWHVDPNGSGGSAATNGDGGDTGWHIDPNG